MVVFAVNYITVYCSNVLTKSTKLSEYGKPSKTILELKRSDLAKARDLRLVEMSRAVNLVIIP